MSTGGRAERQIRRAARAFPPRWREHSGDELVATALASLPADAEGAPRRLLADIVLAGWRERYRDRPPLYRWLLYIVGFRIPTRWQAWARDDINGRFYGQRSYFRAILVVGPLYIPLCVLQGLPWFYPVAQHVVVLALSPILAERWRAKARRRHGILEGIPGGDPPWPPVPRLEPLDQRRTGG